MVRVSLQNITLASAYSPCEEMRAALQRKCHADTASTAAKEEQFSRVHEGFHRLVYLILIRTVNGRLLRKALRYRLEVDCSGSLGAVGSVVWPPLVGNKS